MEMRNRLFVILGIALVLRLALIVLFKTYAHPVTWEYEVIANNILSGRGFVYDFLGVPYRSLNAPLYTFLCVAVYALTNHSYFAVLSIQCLFTSLTALVIFKIGKLLFSENAAFFAAAFVAFHPGFIYYDVFNLIPLSIDSFFIAIVTLLFLKFKDKPTVLNMSLVGCIIGLAALTRGIAASMLPFLAAYLILFVKNSTLRKKAKAIAALMLAAFMVIAPWIMRNYIIHKQFVFIVSTSGENLWRGNNKYAVGTSLNKEGEPILDLGMKDFGNDVLRLNEMEQKKFFEREAFNFIKNNPLTFLKLYFKKIYYFWWFSPQSGIKYSGVYLAAYKYLYSILLVFSIFGLALALLSEGGATRRNAILIVFVFMSIFITQSFFYVEGRHRWLVEPLLIVFFSYGIVEAQKMLTQRWTHPRIKR